MIKNLATITLTLASLLGSAAGAQPYGPPDVAPLATAISQVDRTEIVPGLAHYTFDVTVGAGEHDLFRLHRVVRERAPWVPERHLRGLFLVHGDGWGFDASFLGNLAAPGADPLHTPATYLADAGLDVWGLDFRWALVPAGTGDLSFMADWSFATARADLDLALLAAREVRAVTGSGFGKIDLLGYSRGGQVAYAQLGAESQRPPGLRHVRRFVSVEHTFKTDDEAVRQSACASYDAIEGLIAGGQYASDYSILALLGDLALEAPDEPSPFFPILSNADLAEWIGADPAGGAIPHLHSVGGVVDPATLVTELSYSASESWFSFLSQAASYQPLAVSLDGAAIACDELDTPYDDHLAEVTVPIFYLGVAGGYGALGTYTPTLTGSSDVTSLIVSEAATPALDWGHNDVVLAEDADLLAWDAIVDFVERP